MSFNERPVFNALVTVALAVPLSQSIWFAWAMNSGEIANSTHSLNLPDSLPGWNRVFSSEDIEQRTLVRRNYRNAEGKTLFLLGRQTSAYQTHDFIDCAKAAGIAPQAIATIDLATGKNSAAPLHAAYVMTTTNGQPSLGITWFQNGTLSATSQRDWKMLLLKKAGTLPLPVCRQVYLVAENSKGNQTAKLLADAALAVYQTKM